uniref:Uncharacterized protein n=1 Tax=Poecilia mexicana TaxID=48701 RepID=A0A3B3WE52_9TELE
KSAFCKSLEVQCEVSIVTGDLGSHISCMCWFIRLYKVQTHQNISEYFTLLQTLLLNNNNLTFLSSEAFVHTTRLRYLDLSSNRLTLLDEFIFEPLEKLEILLLFNNCISQIDRYAFQTMVALQKLYLSHNRISRFPVEVLKERSQEVSPFKQSKKEKDFPFKLLDVSFNRIKVLPVKELRAMRAWLKKGVYFHNNTLTCSCELHDLVAYWHLRELSSVSDFADSHTCNMPGKQNEKILKLNCSEVKNLKKEGYLEETMFLDCDTRQKYMAKRWVLPGNINCCRKKNEQSIHPRKHFHPLLSEI